MRLGTQFPEIRCGSCRDGRSWRGGGWWEANSPLHGCVGHGHVGLGLMTLQKPKEKNKKTLRFILKIDWHETLYTAETAVYQVLCSQESS